MEGITKRSQGVFFGVLVAVLMLTPAQGQAQGQQGGQQAAPIEVSNEQVLAFAKGQIQVSKIQQKYNAALSETATNEERQSIVQQANDEMVAAIQNGGLTVELYNTISSQIQNDEQLRNRIMQAMQSFQ